MVVQHNMRAMNSNRLLGITTATQSKSTERLSSGYKINRAADDAAGLSISEKMRKQVRGLTQASANAQDGISAVQTAEGALTEVHDMLQRMNELAVKASNGTLSSDDREDIQREVDRLVEEIDRVSTTTKFNETYLLKGKGSNAAYKDALGEDEDGAAGSFNAATDLSTIIDTASIDTGKGTIGIDSTALGLDLTDNTVIQEFTYGGVNYTLINADEADKNILATADNKTVFKWNDADKLLAQIENQMKTEDGNVKKLVRKDDDTLEIQMYADKPDALNVTLHVGADSTKDNQIGMDIEQMSAKGLGVNAIRVNGSDDSLATAAIDTIANAVKAVSAQRSILGATQNRLEHTINNLDNVVENTTSAESAIRDTDMATEMVKYSNNNILSQAGQAMLAQANQTNQGVLSLLQ